MKKNHEKTVILNPDRTFAFTDGVVAIAITLLILPLTEIALPSQQGIPLPDLIESIWQGNKQTISGFIVTWIILITFWRTHNRVTCRFARLNQATVSWNIVWLFALIVLSFAMTMVIQAEFASVKVTSLEKITVSFYLATMALMSFSMLMIRVQLKRHPELMTEEARNSGDRYPLLIGQMYAGYLIFLALLALHNPAIALGGILGLFVIPLIRDGIVDARQRKDQRHALLDTDD
ncbi:MAG: putative membrane protein [Actinomycetes bacterium]|jgi:uncharacterized membrane protein